MNVAGLHNVELLSEGRFLRILAIGDPSMVLSYLQVKCPSGALVVPWLFGAHFGSPLQSLQACNLALEPPFEALLLRKGRFNSSQVAGDDQFDPILPD